MGEEKSIEGYVDSCHYSNSSSPDFPHGYISFILLENGGAPKGGGPAGMVERYFITGCNKPPIKNNQLVKGVSIEIRSERTGVYNLVAELNLLEPIQGSDFRAIASYDFR